jgi:hypothetical protein
MCLHGILYCFQSAALIPETIMLFVLSQDGAVLESLADSSSAAAAAHQGNSPLQMPTDAESQHVAATAAIDSQSADSRSSTSTIPLESSDNGNSNDPDAIDVIALD